MKNEQIRQSCQKGPGAPGKPFGCIRDRIKVATQINQYAIPISKTVMNFIGSGFKHGTHNMRVLDASFERIDPHASTAFMIHLFERNKPNAQKSLILNFIIYYDEID
jgi:hypothetical protein